MPGPVKISDLTLAAGAGTHTPAPAARSRDVRVGTSGWIYRQWRGGFYPQALSQAKWLGHYAGVFATSEINATFYRLPTQAAVARWREATPPDFEFAWKASRYITHMKRLRDVEPSIARVYAPMLALGAKLGPTLFQLPPQMSCDLPRLRDFLALLPPGRRHVLEFRHPTWYADAVLQTLADQDVGALHLGPPPCPRALGRQRVLRLCPRPRPRRAIPRLLSATRARPVGGASFDLAGRRSRRLRVLRQ